MTRFMNIVPFIIARLEQDDLAYKSGGHVYFDVHELKKRLNITSSLDSASSSKFAKHPEDFMILMANGSDKPSIHVNSEKMVAYFKLVMSRAHSA